MVDLAMRDETTTLLEVVTDFAAERIRPAAADAEERRSTPAELYASVRQIGIVPAIPEQFGGEGSLDAEATLLVAEQLAHGDPGIAFELLATAQAAHLIARGGSAQQAQTWLPKLASGGSASVLCYEGYGRGPSEYTAAARVEGGYRLAGRKIGVVRPADTDLAVVLATVDGEPAAFVLDSDQVHALAVHRDDQASGKLGVKAARTGIVGLSDVTVTEDRRLAGDSLALVRAIALVRLQLGALVLGAVRASHDYARSYATQRVAFGKPIIDFQGVAFPLADVLIGIEANRLNVLAVASELDRLDVDAVERSTTLALNRVFKLGLDATRIGINSLGGHGFLMDHPVERWHRAVATLAALDFDPLASDLDAI